MGRSFPIGYFTALLSGSQHCRTVYYLPVQHEKIHMDTPKLRDLPQYLSAHIPFLFASLSHHFSVKVLDGSRINVNSKCKSIPCTLGARCTKMSVAMRIEFLTSFGFLFNPQPFPKGGNPTHAHEAQSYLSSTNSSDYFGAAKAALRSLRRCRVHGCRVLKRERRCQPQEQAGAHWPTFKGHGTEL